MDLKYGRHQSKGRLLQQVIEGEKSMSEAFSGSTLYTCIR